MPPLFFLPALARRRVPLQQSAALRAPQLAALIAPPDQEFLNLGIGIAAASILAAALRAVPDEDPIGEIVGRLAILKRRTKFFQGSWGHLAQDVADEFLIRLCRFVLHGRLAETADLGRVGDFLAAIPASHVCAPSPRSDSRADSVPYTHFPESPQSRC